MHCITHATQRYLHHRLPSQVHPAAEDRFSARARNGSGLRPRHFLACDGPRRRDAKRRRKRRHGRVCVGEARDQRDSKPHA